MVTAWGLHQFASLTATVLSVLLYGFAIPRPCHAEGQQATEALELFERGLDEASRGAWPDAAASFERSCALVERPGTIFNLILAYDELGRPLSVLRMIQRFMKISDPVRHGAERQQLLQVEARVYGQLARVEPALDSPQATLMVDNEEPVFANDAKVVLLAPGRREVAIQAPGYVPQIRLLDVRAGDFVRLSVQLARVAEPRSLLFLSVSPPATLSREPQQPSSRWRRRTASALLLTGALVWIGAVAADAVAVRRAAGLAERDPEASGYLTASDRYVQARRAVGPLAFGAGAIMASGAVMDDGRLPRAAGWTALFAGIAIVAVGAAAWVAPPEHIARSPLPEPSREHGMVLTTIAVPAIVWGARRLWER